MKREKSKRPTPKRRPSKGPRRKAPTVERTEYRRGAFLLQNVRVDMTGPMTPESRNALIQILEAATPRGRVAKWKPHAERLGAGLDEIAQAETLIDEQGSVADMDKFNLHMARAQTKIDLAQVEETFVPAAVYGAKSKEDRRKGAEEGRRARAQDLGDRNKKIQATIARLCLERGHSFKRARELTAREFSLHPDTLKRISRNPLK